MDEKEPGALGRGHRKAYKRSEVIFMYSFTQQLLNEVPLCDILVGTPQEREPHKLAFKELVLLSGETDQKQRK